MQVPAQTRKCQAVSHPFHTSDAKLPGRENEVGVAEEDDICQQDGKKSARVGDEGESKRAGQLGGVCQTGRVWTSQPAKKSGRSVKGKKNSNADVMYTVYVCPCVSCSIDVLFACISVRSRPDSNEGVGCEIRSLRTNSKILEGP
jgi:hypothetical protein